MAIIKASMLFKKQSIADKVIFGGNVINALTIDAAKPSPLFPALPVSLTDLQSINANLLTASNALINGGRNAKQAAKAATQIWNQVFTMDANYVTMASQNDPQTIALAGYIPTKGTREKKPIPGVATTFKATINGTKGAILAGAKKKVPGAVAHIVTALPASASISYSENTVVITIGNDNIYIGAFTGKGTELYNMNSGKPFSISMFSVNAAGHGPATPAQEVIPQ